MLACVCVCVLRRTLLNMCVKLLRVHMHARTSEGGACVSLVKGLLNDMVLWFYPKAGISKKVVSLGG